MCDPVTITVAALGAGEAAAGILGDISGYEQRKQQNRLSSRNAQLQRGQVGQQLEQQTEANAQQAFELARSVVASKGAARNAGVSDRSVRALSRAIGFQYGQDKASLARNQEIARETAAAKLRAISITRASEKVQIGDRSKLGLGLNIFSSAVGGASTAGSLIGGLSSLSIPGGSAAAGAAGGSAPAMPSAEQLGFRAPAPLP